MGSLAFSEDEQEHASISPDNQGETAGGLKESHFMGDSDVEDKLSISPTLGELDKFIVGSEALGNRAADLPEAMDPTFVSKIHDEEKHVHKKPPENPDTSGKKGYMLGWKGDFEPSFSSLPSKKGILLKSGDEKFEKRRRKKLLKTKNAITFSESEVEEDSISPENIGDKAPGLKQAFTIRDEETKRQIPAKASRWPTLSEASLLKPRLSESPTEEELDKFNIVGEALGQAASDFDEDDEEEDEADDEGDAEGEVHEADKILKKKKKKKKKKKDEGAEGGGGEGKEGKEEKKGEE